MLINRREFVAYTALGLTASGTALSRGKNKSKENRKYVINGNMVIEPSFGDPLDTQTKEKLQSTRLTAIKLSLGGSKGTYEQAHEILDSLPEVYTANPDTLMNINSVIDLNRAYDTKRTGIIYSFEAATMLGDQIERIAEFSSRGVRIMQLGYNHTSPFGAGVMSTNGNLGISNLGAEAVAAMEANKVLLDLSHAHELTALDALELCTKPASMTHTGCDAINPHQRNRADKTLRAVAKTGGIVGIYEMSYLTPDLDQQSLDAFMSHIFHAINVCGEDHVGIGSDTPILGFDTGPESMAQWNEINRMRAETGVAAPGEGPPPYVEGINGPERMTIIAEELGNRGLRSSAIDKIIGNNFARVFSETW